MELNSEKREKYEKHTHVEFIEIYKYLSDKTYPGHITDKGLKSSFRKACKNFENMHNELRYKCNERMVLQRRFLACLKY